VLTVKDDGIAQKVLIVMKKKCGKIRSCTILEIFRAIPFRNTFLKRLHRWQAISCRASCGDIRGKSAFPALEGRHFLLTFFCC
jgi:hypothetical protein